MMQNKSAFLTVMALFAYIAYIMWRGLLNEGFSLLRFISLALIVTGIALILFTRVKAFLKGIYKSLKNK